MDREYKLKEITTGNKIPTISSSVLAEGDVIVPDILPDVESIMSVDATAFIRKCEKNDKLIKVSGSIFINILYLPDAEGEKKLSVINTKFDFSDEIKYESSQDLNIFANGNICHIDFSLINSRKLNLKIYLELNIFSHSTSSFRFLDCDVEPGLIEINPAELEIYNVKGNVSKDIIVTENINLPSDKADIGEILKVDIELFSPEYKVSNGRLMVKGLMCVSVLYLSADTDEEAECVSKEIPFSEIIEAEFINENSIASLCFCLKDYYYNVKNDINDDPRCVFVEALVCANAVISEKNNVIVAKDCFIPGKNCSVATKELDFQEKKCNIGGKISLKERIISDEGIISEILLCSIKPVISEEILDNSHYHLKGIAAICIIYKTSDNGIIFKNFELPIEYRQNIKLDEGTDVFAEVILSLSSKNCSVSGGELELSAAFDISGEIFASQKALPVISCKAEESDAECPPMLIIYFVKSGDTLWEIAKKYKTTPEKIISANNILSPDEIQAGMKLLIPAF